MGGWEGVGWGAEGGVKHPSDPKSSAVPSESYVT